MRPSCSLSASCKVFYEQQPQRRISYHSLSCQYYQLRLCYSNSPAGTPNHSWPQPATDNGDTGVNSHLFKQGYCGPLDDQLWMPSLRDVTHVAAWRNDIFNKFWVHLQERKDPCSLIDSWMPSTSQSVVASGAVRTDDAIAPEMATEWTRMH